MRSAKARFCSTTTRARPAALASSTRAAICRMVAHCTPALGAGEVVLDHAEGVSGRLGLVHEGGHLQDVLPLHALARLVEQQQRLAFGVAARGRQHLLLAARERAGMLGEGP